MIYFKQAPTGEIVDFSFTIPADYSDPQWRTIHDFTTLDKANEVKTQIAELAIRNNSPIAGKTLLATDDGEWVYPRFGIVVAPSVGDPVSYGFNGDVYPDGEIARITPTFSQIVTTTGHRYYRRGKTAAWVRYGTWSLIAGHHNERNPSF